MKSLSSRLEGGIEHDVCRDYLGRELGIPMEVSNIIDQKHVEALFRGLGPQDSDAVANLQEACSFVSLVCDDSGLV